MTELVSVQQLLEKYMIAEFKQELNALSEPAKVEVSGFAFKKHKCKDYGVELIRHGAKRCRACNMRIVGRRKKRK